MNERELYAHMLELTRRELEEKEKLTAEYDPTELLENLMCKGDSQPLPPRHPPRLTEEKKSVISMPDWTPYAEDLVKKINNAPTPQFHGEPFWKKLEEMSSEPSYREKALSPEVVQLQKRLDLENAENRSLARKVDRLQAELQILRDANDAPNKWIVKLILLGFSSGMIIFIFLHYVFHLI